MLDDPHRLSGEKNEVFSLIQGTGNILVLWPVSRSMASPNYWLPLGSIETCSFVWSLTLVSAISKFLAHDNDFPAF